MKKLLGVLLIVGQCALLSAQNLTVLQTQFDSLYQKSNVLAAIPVGEVLVDGIRKQGVRDTTIFSRTLIRMAACYNNTRRLNQAGPIIEEAFLYTTPGSLGHAVLLKYAGDWAFHTDQNALADSLLTTSMAEYRVLNREHSSLGLQCLSSLISLKIEDNLLQDAENLIESELAYLKSAGAPLHESLLSSMAQVATLQGRHAAAMEYWRQSIDLIAVTTPPGSPSQVYRYNLYIPLLAQEGQFFKADSLLRQLLLDVEAASGKESPDYLYTLQTCGFINNNLNNLPKAEQFLQQSYDLAKRLDGPLSNRSLSQATLLGSVYHGLGRSDQARLLIEPFRDSLARFSDALQGEALGLLAQCSRDTAEALQFARQAVALFRQHSGVSWGGNYAPYLLEMVELLHKNSHFREAQQQLAEMADLEQAMSPTDPSFADYLSLKGTNAALLGDFKSAQTNWQGLRNLHVKTFYESAFYLRETDRTQRLGAFEKNRNRLLTWAEKSPELVETALDFQLFTNSLLLSATQNVRKNVASDSVLAPVFSTWVDAREHLAWCYTQRPDAIKAQKINLPYLEQRADSLERTLARRSVAFAQSRLESTFDWTTVRSALQQGEAALEIVRFLQNNNAPSDSVRYAIFVITPDRAHPDLVNLPNAARLETFLTEKYLNECATTTGKGLTDDWYTAVWGRLLPYLSGVKRLYVSADGCFHKINLGAIRLPDGSFVADQVEIQRVFSLKDLLTPPLDNTTPRANPTALLVGNPAFSARTESALEPSRLRSVAPAVLEIEETAATLPYGTVLPALPGSEREVNDVSALLRKKGWTTTVLTQSNATESRVKTATSPTVLHLATHGYFLPNEPSSTTSGSPQRNPMLRSLLFFAGAQNTLDKKASGQSDDGILSAYEVQNLRLDHTELVVLSACQTAQGKIQNGEGVFGLQRALRIAGAQNLLISLWDVDDRVGREFVTLFYQKWLGGATQTAAFRAAQLEIKRKHPQPFYWAGFVLIN